MPSIKQGPQVLRHGPWRRIDKKTARKLYYSADVEMGMSPSNINDYWVFNMGYLYRFDTKEFRDIDGVDFDWLVRSFEAGLDPKEGRYAHFWVKEE